MLFLIEVYSRVCSDGITSDIRLVDLDGVMAGRRGIASLLDLPVNSVGARVDEGGVLGAPLAILAGAIVSRRTLGLSDSHSDGVRIAVIGAIVTGAGSLDSAVLDGEGVGACYIIVVASSGDGIADGVLANLGEAGNLL